jgi:hypothetical protein
MRASVAAVLICALIGLYVVIWQVLTPLGRAEFERYAVAICMVVASVMYAFIVVSFIWARKTGLNLAFAAKHLLWGAFVILFAIPNALGVIWNHAPYQLNRPPNPYSLYDIPAGIRTALWIGIAMSAIGVIYEFYDANWDGPIWRPIPRWKAKGN